MGRERERERGQREGESDRYTERGVEMEAVSAMDVTSG